MVEPSRRMGALEVKASESDVVRGPLAVRHYSAAASIALALALIVGAGGYALAQQSQSSRKLTLPQAQGSGASVLELPPLPSGQRPEPTPLPNLGPQRGPELVLPSRQLRNRPGYAQVTATVTNPSGAYVAGLQKGDFKLYINGVQRPIEFFRHDLNTPVSVGILVDTSGSMDPKIPQAQAAIAQFVHDLNPRDDIFLIAFSGTQYLLQPFTDDHSLLISRLPLLHAYGQTALFDTIADGLMMVQHGRFDKKALLVVTDGMDTASTSYRLSDLISMARKMGVLVYSIGIGNPNVSGSGGNLSIPFFGPLISPDLDRVDARTLQTLSSETGAKTFILREVGDGETLRAATALISRELREQYTIGFVAPDPGAGGYRSLHVEVPGRPADSVRVRKGVTIRPRSADAGSP